MNHVSLLGRIVKGISIREVDGIREALIDVETSAGARKVIHHVVLRDEFLSTSIASQIVDGETIHVLGELDYDEKGAAIIVVPPRRGFDISVFQTAKIPVVENDKKAQAQTPISSNPNPATNSTQPINTRMPVRPAIPPLRPASPATTPKPAAPEPDSNSKQPDQPKANSDQQPSSNAAPSAPPRLVRPGLPPQARPLGAPFGSSNGSKPKDNPSWKNGRNVVGSDNFDEDIPFAVPWR